jgi:branched-chain amino acid transport system permease protein
MLYREAGDFKTSYAADQALVPIRQDRLLLYIVLALAIVVAPLFGSDYFLGSIAIPVLIMAIAAIGLNLLLGYCGQISLGTGAFMATGAYMAYKIATGFEWLPMPVTILLAGLATAAIGIVFGLPSLRIKGFYLAVATLAAQFFLLWLFTHVPWFVNYSMSGVPTPPPSTVLGVYVTGAQAPNWAKYLFVLSFAIFLTWIAYNLVRSRIGRSWMAIRDMDIAAELIGIRPLWTKLTAFAFSSFYCGVAGALWAFCFINTVEPTAFDINRSFQVLFMVMIGGLGSILGSYMGAIFIVLLPIFLNSAPAWFGYQIPGDLLTHIEFMIFGSLIVFILIAEPNGIARLWQIGKEKLRLWPFPH